MNHKKSSDKEKKVESALEDNVHTGRWVHIVMNVDRCVCCGVIVPEGYMVCSECNAGRTGIGMKSRTR